MDWGVFAMRFDKQVFPTCLLGIGCSNELVASLACATRVGWLGRKS
jgi:hypothetical protein